MTAQPTPEPGRLARQVPCPTCGGKGTRDWPYAPVDGGSCRQCNGVGTCWEITDEPAVSLAAVRAWATHELAEFYRAGMHDLRPYWSADKDGDVDPLDDPETRTIVRRWMARQQRQLAALRTLGES